MTPPIPPSEWAMKMANEVLDRIGGAGGARDWGQQQIAAALDEARRDERMAWADLFDTCATKSEEVRVMLGATDADDLEVAALIAGEEGLRETATTLRSMSAAEKKAQAEQAEQEAMK